MAKSNLDIMQGLTEFLALADRLEMPDGERQGILGIDEDGWDAVAASRVDSAMLMTAEFRRRLAYVLPLMRKAIENREKGGLGRLSDERPRDQLLS